MTTNDLLEISVSSALDLTTSSSCTLPGRQVGHSRLQRTLLGRQGPVTALRNRSSVMLACIPPSQQSSPQTALPSPHHTISREFALSSLRFSETRGRPSVPSWHATPCSCSKPNSCADRHSRAALPYAARTHVGGYSVVHSVNVGCGTSIYRHGVAPLPCRRLCSRHRCCSSRRSQSRERLEPCDYTDMMRHGQRSSFCFTSRLYAFEVLLFTLSVGALILYIVNVGPHEASSDILHR